VRFSNYPNDKEDIMSEEFGTPVPPTSRPITEIWIQALTQPNEESYRQIAEDPGGSVGKAAQWVYIAGLVSYLFSVLVGSLTGTMDTFGDLMGTGFVSILCVVLFFPLFNILGLMLNAGITQLIASALGGTGDFTKLFWTIAAYSVPFSLITAVLGIIPIVQCLVLPLAFYGIFLSLLSVKAVNQFSWGKAVMSSLAIWILLMVLVIVMVIGVLALLGPAIGNVFSDIITEI
jgi:hypothetical protein